MKGSCARLVPDCKGRQGGLGGGAAPGSIRCGQPTRALLAHTHTHTHKGSQQSHWLLAVESRSVQLCSVVAHLKWVDRLAGRWVGRRASFLSYFPSLEYNHPPHALQLSSTRAGAPRGRVLSPITHHANTSKQQQTALIAAAWPCHTRTGCCG
jgi:hypothetical protein